MLPDYNTVTGRFVRLIIGIIGSVFAIGWLPFVQKLFGTPAWLRYGFENEIVYSNGFGRDAYISWVDSEQLDMYFKASEAVATKVMWPQLVLTCLISVVLSALIFWAFKFLFGPLFGEDALPCDGSGCKCLDHVWCKDKSCPCKNHPIEGWNDDDAETSVTQAVDDETGSALKPQDWAPPNLSAQGANR